MSKIEIHSPEKQSATFIELFFDLVFVFAVTQMVGLLHDGLTFESIGRALLIFWLVYWAWSQFTWALNTANTLHPMVELGTLGATALAFFMAIAIPEAFERQALLFAGAYVLVRVIGLTINAHLARAGAEESAVRVFATLSIGGLVAVVVGAFMGGNIQIWAWLAAVALDLVAGAIGGSALGRSGIGAIG